MQASCIMFSDHYELVIEMKKDYIRDNEHRNFKGGTELKVVFAVTETSKVTAVATPAVISPPAAATAAVAVTETAATAAAPQPSAVAAATLATTTAAAAKEGGALTAT